MTTETRRFQEAVGLHRAGRFDEADRIYRGLLRIDPSHADALHLSGLCSVQTGNAAEALPSLRRAVELRPDSAAYHTSLGTALQSCGESDSARVHFERALSRQPDFIDARFNLANLLLEKQQFAAAVEHYRHAQRLSPDNADILNNLGTALRRLGDVSDAEQCYHDALRLQPQHAGVLRNTAGLLHSLGRLAEAIGLYERLLEIQSDALDARNNFAVCLHESGRFGEAEKLLQLALEDHPDSAEAWINLGCVYNDLSRSEDAIRCFREALECDPDSAAARNNLGNALKAAGRFKDAAEEYAIIIQSRPQFLAAVTNLAGVRQSQGRTEEARSLLKRANAIKPDPLREFEEAVLLPPVYDSLSHLQDCRERLEASVCEMQRHGLVIDPSQRIVPSLFYAAYHGRNDRDLMASAASLFQSSFDYRRRRAGHRIQNKERVRIGYLSAFLGDHTIGRLMHGIIRRLDRERFDVCLLSPNISGNTADLRFGTAVRMIDITRRLNVALERVADANLDVLVYPDVGMDPLTSTLARTRLAPVQCVTWGHPVTTGMSMMDYFLSSDLLETEAAAGHYTERLVRLDRPPCCYARPEPAETGVSRSLFGLPEGRPLYLCLQSLFKFHPEFDEILAGILDCDRFGLLVMLDSPHEHWKQTLQQRWSRCFARHVDRIVWMPRMLRSRFLQLLTLGDVMLDPIHFGGGNTNYEAMAYGVPIVTLPSEFLRGRVASGLYRMMGITDCVADTDDDYVTKAVSAANDGDFRTDCRERILASSHLIFDDDSAVRELEQFWIAAQTSPDASARHGEIQRSHTFSPSLYPPGFDWAGKSPLTAHPSGIPVNPRHPANR